MNLNDILIDLLNSEKKTDKEISQLTGIPQPRISEWKKNKRQIKIESLDAIVTALGYKIKIEIEK